MSDVLKTNELIVAKLREVAKQAEWYHALDPKLLTAAADALEAATRERDAAVARVRAIHYSAQAGVEICGVCLVPFPCATVAALDGAPEPEVKP